MENRTFGSKFVKFIRFIKFNTNISANFEDIIDALTPKDLRQYARQLFGKANVIDLIFRSEE